jgi:histidinol dehydrogenase
MEKVFFTKLEEVEKVLVRPSYDFAKIEKIVAPILEKVKRGGDKALKKFALEYDHVELDSLWVSEDEFARAEKEVNPELKEAIRIAHDNIKKFHEAQVQPEIKVKTMPGVICRRKSVPIEKVGLYIPGGTAPLFSTVLMLGVPAIIAGCKEIIMASPTNKIGEINPVVLYTANLIGITKILKLGGAQAVAALAYGSESVPRVDKIFGPGNQYVTVAKQMVARDSVAIDMPAGPSEVLVVVDETSNAAFAASDLLSQAEHGLDSQVVLVSASDQKVDEILEEVDNQLQKLKRKDIARESLKNSAAVVTHSLEETLAVVNSYAPEHLIINVEKPGPVVEGVYNAGSVFIGPYTPESAGDYASGTNHTLPTNGWARSYSGVSLDSYVKKITYQEITEKGLKKLGPAVEKMAEAELLDAHKNAVSVRLASLK